MAHKHTLFGKTALLALTFLMVSGAALNAGHAAPAAIDQEVLEPQTGKTTEEAAPKTAEPAAPETPAADPQYPDIRPPTRIMPSKITPLQNNSDGGDGMSKAAPEFKTSESVGHLELLTIQTPTTGNTESLKLFYDGPQDRKDLLTLFKGLSPASHSITVQESAVWLLSNLAPDDSEQDSDKSAVDDDIYSLRLDRLLKFGELEKTLILYKMNEGQPPTTAAAKSGIVAMLARNEAAVACLEEKALPADITSKDKAFWGKVDLFCKGLLSPAAGDDDQLRYSNAARIYLTASSAVAPATFADFNKLDEVTQLSFAERGALPADISAKSVKELDTLALALILSRKHAISEEKLELLLAEAVKRGLLHAANLTQLAQDLTELKNTPEPQDKSAKKTDVKTVTYSNNLIQKLNNAADISPATFKPKLGSSIESALAIAALRESTELPEGYDTLAAGDAASARQAAILFAQANQPPAKDWVMAALAITPTESNAKTFENMTGDDVFCEYFLTQGNDSEKARTALITAIQPFLASEIKSSKPAKDVYDNIFNLTDSSNYVMPSSDILSSLKKEAIKKPSKQAVTQSLSILSAQPVNTLHPAALYRVLNVLKSAGLSVQTKSLGHEVLGYILEN